LKVHFKHFIYTKLKLKFEKKEPNEYYNTRDLKQEIIKKLDFSSHIYILDVCAQVQIKY